MTYKITIPEPCSENWNAMAPTQKGAFCASCKKEVFDFTAHSLNELARKVQELEKSDAGHNLCGRFRPDQLNTPLPTLTRNRWRDQLAAAGFTAVVGMGASVSAQTRPLKQVEVVSPMEIDKTIVINQPNSTAHEQPAEEPGSIMGGVSRATLPMPEEGVAITGRILDQEGMPLPGAHVQLIGTRLSTSADFDGVFTLKVAPKLRSAAVWLQVFYLGFKIERVRVAPEFSEEMVLKLEMSEEVLGELVVVEQRTIFRRIGAFFRRIF